MENRQVVHLYRVALFVLILWVIGAISFAAGLAWSKRAWADQPSVGPGYRKGKVVYPEKTDLDFEGMGLEGEIRNPGEFYFQHRPEEKFDSLVKRRKNFHREMLRDAVLSK